MARITLELDDADTRAAISHMLGLLENPTAALDDIGEYLIVSTKERFGTGTAPSGEKWKPNTALTLSRKKDPRPLHGESGRLGNEILKFVDQAEVEVGSNLIYAAVQQFGARQGAFGRSRRGGPIPWGDIWARPFLGLSVDDTRAVLDIVEEHLAGPA